MAILCLTLNASAYDFEVDGFYYEVNLEKMTATLVSGETKQSGEIVIPSSVSYKGREFCVNSINGAFRGNTELTGIKLPNSIVSLGENAFYGCSSLVSISGLDNITELGVACFANCVSLTKIELSEDLKKIGSQAFKGCVGLSAISIPNAVNSIGSEAFQDCSSISHIQFPPTIASLSKGLFKGCTSLENFEIPNSVTSIEDEVFSGCVELQATIIPSSIQYIGDGVFFGCVKLSKITFEGSSSTINVGYNRCYDAWGYTSYSPLFEDCNVDEVDIKRNIHSSSRHRGSHLGCFAKTNVKKVQFSEDVTFLEEGAFESCWNLSEIIIPRSVISIGESAFYSSGLRKVTFEDGYDTVDLALKISSWEYKTPETFSNCKIEDVYLGRTLKVESGSQNPGYGGSPTTFFPNTLKQIIIGDYVDNIDVLLMSNQKVTSSLSHYPNLVVAQFGVNLHQLPSMADNKLLEMLSTSSTVPPTANPFTNSQYMDLNVEIPIGSLNAYQEAPIWKNFWNISQKKDLLHCFEVDDILYKIISESTVEVIKKSTEYSGDIVIPTQIEYNDVKYEVTSIGDAFKGCSILTSITIPQSVYSLANNCFKDCVRLKDVVFDCFIEEIPFGAFQNCRSLSKIHIPETIKYVRGNAFNGCSKLEEFSCPNSLELIGEAAFEKCYSLKRFSLNNVSVIESAIFEDCNGLEAVFLNSMISVIPQNCFSGCSNLESVSPLNSVVRIEAEAFKDCKVLKNISIPNIISIFDNAFHNCSGIETMALGDGLEMIGKGAFSYCSKLESLIIPGDVETFGTSMLSGCSSLKELTFAEGNSPLSLPAGSYDGATGIQKKEINGKTIQYKIQYYNAFFDGLPIEKLNIRRNLSDSPRYTIVGDGGVDYYLITSYDAPFNNLPKLKELTIGENVDILGPIEEDISEVDMYITPGSFKKCSALEKVIVKNTTPPSGAEFSTTAYSKADLIVPDNTVSLYKTADGWKDFLNILDETSADIEEIRTNDGHECIILNGEGILYTGESIENLEVYGIDGRLIHSSVVTPNQSVTLSNGMYMVRINNKSFKVRI